MLPARHEHGLGVLPRQAAVEPVDVLVALVDVLDVLPPPLGCVLIRVGYGHVLLLTGDGALNQGHHRRCLMIRRG